MHEELDRQIWRGKEVELLNLEKQLRQPREKKKKIKKRTKYKSAKFKIGM